MYHKKSTYSMAVLQSIHSSGTVPSKFVVVAQSTVNALPPRQYAFGTTPFVPHNAHQSTAVVGPGRDG